VVDTNVLISGTFWTGKPKQLINLIRQGNVTFVTSKALMDELREVLIREDKPFRLSAEEAEHIIGAIHSLAEMIQVHSRVSICKDERDNRVLECAKDGDADYIISGDGHLLELESFKKVRILQVNEFLRYYYGT
jgi:putative PIN family toxin of toxin-antitoxin system